MMCKRRSHNSISELPELQVMKVTSVVALLAAIVAVNAAAVDITPNAKYVALDKRDCGAAGACHGAEETAAALLGKLAAATILK
ncbi:hypothetical protein Unana1_00129 [Umbelopsis nana]